MAHSGMTRTDAFVKVPDPHDPLINRRAAVNPYRAAIREILFRLSWDVRAESWKSRGKMKALLNCRRGGKAVILCNGPSLNRVDLGALESVYCFGLNKIHLLFDRTAFRPDAIVCVNKHVIMQAAAFFNATEIPLFLDARGLSIVSPTADRVFFPGTGLSRTFARDCSMSIYPGYTVTYVALQLAFHMGFDRVALVGCDHYFHRQGAPNKTVAAAGDDPDHFDPAYFSGVKWQLPDLFESEISYRTALDVYRASGRLLVNATDGGRLEVLPRMSLDDFMRL
jgi:hypothetical protein